MPNFKPKATKKILTSKKNNITLDSKHNEMLLKFDKNKKKIPELIKRKNILKNKINNKNISLEEKLNSKDEITKIKSKISKLKKEKNEYLLDNSECIFSYFEEKKKMTQGNTKTKMLHSFFNKKKEEEEDVNSKYVKKYLSNVDDSFLNINDYKIIHDICQTCKGELIYVLHEGVVICNKCSTQFPYLIEHEKPSYKEPPKEVCFYAYKRINHFREILAQFQAKETTQIPKEVLENIVIQIKKERMRVEDMTNQNAKDILKKLGYNKYYEHIPFIKDKLGIKPPVMHPQLEDKLCSLFMEIQSPYAKHCPDNRVNFLNYYYVLYKICELLGEVKFLPFFPLLKDPVKRIEQDEIWKKICKELNWEYIETI
tara:strand:- start:423 stop:1532 length:1110 start_codon:yes stop_codon:yes gene_type:complete